MTKQDRVDVANSFIRIVSTYGRRFFYHGGRISRFEWETVVQIEAGEKK